MASKKARGQITITDLNDAKTVYMYLSVNHAKTQVYTDGAYEPDYTTNALVITPEIYASGGDGSNLIAQCASAPTWTINGTAAASFGSATVGTASPWALTIKKNMTDTQQWDVECSVKWTDTDTGLTLTIKAGVTLSKLANAGSLVFARVVGVGVIRNDTESVTLEGQLIRGGAADPDTTEVTYQWQSLESAGWTDISGATAQTYTVKASAVDSKHSYRVMIKDTGPKSGTYNQTFTSDIFTVTDISDPYQLEIYSSNGIVFVNGSTNSQSTVLTPVLRRNGYEVTDTSGMTFKWSAVDKDGTAKTLTSAQQSGKTLTVTSDMVNVRTTFTLDVTIN